jgi:integrase
VTPAEKRYLCAEHDQAAGIGDLGKVVHLLRFLVDDLAEHVAGRAPDELVIASSTGTVMPVRNARRAWFHRAAVAVELPGLTPHELRHTAASLAVSAGANVKAVQRMLGHATASMTLDVVRRSVR